MRHERQIELLRRLKGLNPTQAWPLEERTMCNPASHYVDPARFERERAVLFRRRPQLIALSCELSAPGASLTAELGGVPIAVVRQGDGRLRGFVNACRHRGAPVVAAGDDARPRLTCPYHGWVYDLDGSLLARPYAEEAFADAPRRGLKPIWVAEKYGLILAQLEGDAPSVDAALHGAELEIAPYELEGYAFVEGRENVLTFNWKLVLDTFCESYHIRALHKNSIAASYLSEMSICDAFGPHPRMIGLLKSVLTEIEKPDEADWRFLPHTTSQLIFMPSGLITYQRDHIELWRLTPLAVDRTLVRTSLYAPESPATDRARRRNLDMLLDVTTTEDFPLMAKIHAGLAAGAIDELVYGRNEPALIHLHRSINAALDGTKQGTPWLD
jgi:phenylpropionate dioxygenase-like ring-hydroxylating dioxygenase large terminal subunit